jgi:hypothetical protein
MKLLSFLSKKKPKIRFYSLISAVQTLYPITQSRELKREWVSSEKEDYKCPAVHNIMNTGFIMYAPADFKVHTNGDEDTILFSSSKIMPYADYVTTHNEEVAQWLIRNPSHYIFPKVVKVNTPWRVICDNDIVFIQTPVSFNSENRFSAVMGLVDPMMSHELNVQLFWHIKEGDITIKAGTPLCQYIPISRSLLYSLDYIIDDLTAKDIKMEDEYLYLRSTMFPETSDFQTRVSRMMKIIKKYH